MPQAKRYKGSFEEADAEAEDLPYEHDQVPVSGLIFGCNEKTRGECLRRQLFGMAAVHQGLVNRVVPGSKVFLFNFQKKELYGIYEAVSRGGHDLEPAAWAAGGSSFPAQVRVRCVARCEALPVSAFRKAVEANFYTQHKFSYELQQYQVDALLQLFRREQPGSSPFTLHGKGGLVPAPAGWQARPPGCESGDHLPAGSTGRRVIGVVRPCGKRQVEDEKDDLEEYRF
eukprot:jgi/Mesen1/9654/ME000671S09020